MNQITNLLKLAFTIIILLMNSIDTKAQSILGTWQLVKETTCLEEQFTAENDTLQPVLDDMKSMSSPTPQVVSFKEKGAGVESTRILNKKKSANKNNFLYRFDGEVLLILDKKSQTLTETFTVDKFSSDSLILSNNARACETKIFLKIKDAKSN